MVGSVVGIKPWAVSSGLVQEWQLRAGRERLVTVSGHFCSPKTYLCLEGLELENSFFPKTIISTDTLSSASSLCHQETVTCRAQEASKKASTCLQCCRLAKKKGLSLTPQCSFIAVGMDLPRGPTLLFWRSLNRHYWWSISSKPQDQMAATARDSVKNPSPIK